MTLNFPNQNRSYDERRNFIRFWGYDSAMEIPFFIEVEAIFKLNPQAGDAETGCLDAFDSARDRIHTVARRVYSRARKGPYLLVSADF